MAAVLRLRRDPRFFFVFGPAYLVGLFFCDRSPSGVTLDLFFRQPRTSRLCLRPFPLRRDSRFFFSPACTSMISFCDSSSPPACLSIIFLVHISTISAAGLRLRRSSRCFFTTVLRPRRDSRFFLFSPAHLVRFFFFAAVLHLRRDSRKTLSRPHARYDLGGGSSTHA